MSPQTWTQTPLTLLLLLLTAWALVRGELKVQDENEQWARGLQFPQLDPGPVQYVVTYGDYLGLNRLSSSENRLVQEVCGLTKETPKNLPFKIASGIDAKRSQFPWAVSITYNRSTDLNYCSGLLISSRHVVTAAHCLSKYTKAQVPCEGGTPNPKLHEMVVNYGGVCLRQGSSNCHQGRDMITVGIRKAVFVLHFNDNQCQVGGDVALLELEQDLTFDDNVTPICLGHLRHETLTHPIDMGFGRGKENKRIDGLRFFPSIIDRVEENMGIIHSVMASVGQTGQASICKGDSGGGLQATHAGKRVFALGVHSYGHGCEKEPTQQPVQTSTHLLQFVDWICRQTGVCRPPHEVHLPKAQSMPFEWFK